MGLNIKGRGTNYIGYQGYVVISTIDKSGHKVKRFNAYNSGTPKLGEIISRSLLRGSQYTVQDTEKPYSLGFLTKAEKGVGQRITNQTVPFSGIVFGDAVELPPELQADRVIGQLKLTAILTRSSVNLGLSTSNMELTINDARGNVLAYIDDVDISELGESILANVYSALKVQDVLIEWYMLILNK